MGLKDAINKTREMTERMNALPRFEKARNYEQILFPEHTIKQKREKICGLLRPFLEDIRKSISEYQLGFTKEAFLETRERYETVKGEVGDLERRIGETGLAEKISDIKDLCKKRDMLKSQQPLCEINFNVGNKQLKEMLLTTGCADLTRFSEEFCNMLSEDMLKSLVPPSERELESLSRIREVLSNHP